MEEDHGVEEEKKAPAQAANKRASLSKNFPKDGGKLSNRSIRFSAQGFSSRNIDQSPRVGGQSVVSSNKNHLSLSQALSE